MEHVVRNLLVERGGIEQAMGNIIPEIEAAALFNVDQGEVSPESFLEYSTHPLVGQDVVQVLGLVNTRMIPRRLSCRDAQPSEELSQSAFHLRYLSMASRMGDTVIST